MRVLHCLVFLRSITAFNISADYPAPDKTTTAPEKLCILLSAPSSRAIPRPRREGEDEHDDSVKVTRGERLRFDTSKCDWAGEPDSWEADLEQLSPDDQHLMKQMLKVQEALGSQVLGVHIAKVRTLSQRCSALSSLGLVERVGPTLCKVQVTVRECVLACLTAQF